MFCRKLLLIVAVLTVAALGVAGPANATITYTLNAPNIDLATFPGPYGYVDVTFDALDHKKAKITFTAAPVNAENYTYQFKQIGVNTNGAVSVNPGSPVFQFLGTKNLDAQGTFNCTFKQSGSPFPTVWFTISRATAWASEGDVLTPNSDGHRAAAHMQPYLMVNGNAVIQSQTGWTGDVPEPASLAVWGLGACAVGLVGGIRRRIARQT